MRHPIFVEHFRHFLGDHFIIVWNENERDFFSCLGRSLWSGSFWALGWSFWCVTHTESIHYQEGEKGSYSNASREERSGNVFWQAVQVRK
jgi:hypothetical protein